MPARKTAETLDTDSVMTFLSHLGVRQHEVHKRISDTLMKALIDEIRKSGAGGGSSNNNGGGGGSMSSAHKDRLLDLLKSCWMYATTIPELRPVLWAVLKQLGEVRFEKVGWLGVPWVCVSVHQTCSRSQINS